LLALLILSYQHQAGKAKQAITTAPARARPALAILTGKAKQAGKGTPGGEGNTRRGGQHQAGKAMQVLPSL